MTPAYLESEQMLYAREPMGLGGNFYGAYPGLVLDVTDQDGEGKVLVSLPWSPDAGGSSYSAWARVATMMAGNNQGSWFIPDVGVEVLVIFLGGNPRQPCVIGALWNGKDAPPQSMDKAGKNNIKKLQSRNGVTITLDDTQSSEALTLETPGQRTIAMQDGAGSIEISDALGNSITLDQSGITLQTSGQISMSASQVEITAGLVTVNAGMSQFNGATQHDSILTTTIVSTSYTPGAGNLL
ncbi:MAG TPA: phage baseplate assembly protein V [Terracidiphilus sp.]|jgi:uncharacterized protein involved in type VI secretion and phage assembly